MRKQLTTGIILVLLSTNLVVLGIRSDEGGPLTLITSSDVTRAKTKIYVDPDFVSEPVSNSFNITVRLANVSNLFGVEMRFSWDPVILDYVDHVAKIPVDTYPDGILHGASPLWIANNVNATGGTYDLAVSSFGFPVPPSFNGSGIIFEMTFQVVDVGYSLLEISTSDLASKPNSTHPAGLPIIHDVVNGVFDNSLPQFQLSIEVVGSGTTDPPPGSYDYIQDTVVPVDAIPDSGWELNHWLLDNIDVGSTDPYDVTMNSNHNLTAVFVRIQHQLIINILGLGTTDPPPGIYLYHEGSEVQVSATPGVDWFFDHWLLDAFDIGSDNPYNVTIDADHTLTAVFNQVTHDVAIANITTSKTGCLPMATVGQGYNVSIYVTVENQGTVDETFNVSIYTNSSIISVLEVMLGPGENRTLTFKWNTAVFEKGNYTMKATTEAVPGEVDVVDNTFTNGIIFVTFPGDFDGDKDVDIYDIVRLAGVYGSERSDPEYDPNSDVEDDGDIDIYDVVIAADHYAEYW